MIQSDSPSQLLRNMFTCQTIPVLPEESVGVIVSAKIFQMLGFEEC